MDGLSEFVGRKKILRAAEQALASPTPAAMLLTGEAGIGKSRTAQEIAARASAASWKVVVGRCSEVPGAPPLWPWVEPISELMAALGPERTAAVIGSGSPVWSLLGRESGLQAAAEGPEARFRLMRDVAALFSAACERQRWLLFLDDLHQADVATAELLAHLVRRAPVTGLAVLGALRDDALPAEGGLAQALGEVAREARTLPLSALPESEAGALAERLASRDLAPELKRELTKRSQGNPLFLRQLVELLAGAEGRDEGAALTRLRRELPEGVRHVIRERLRGAGAETEAVLRRAAVLGRSFEIDALARLCEDEEPSIAAALDIARRRGLLQPGTQPGSFVFGHVLFRDVLYQELPAETRAEAHRAAARVLAELRDVGVDPWLSNRAHHLLEGRALGQPGALGSAIAAVEGALEKNAHEEAAALGEALLGAVERDGGDRGRSPEAARLLRLLGEAHWRCGSPERARERFESAMARARDLGDWELLAEAAFGYAGRTDAVLGPEDRSVAFLEEALARLDPAPSRLRALLLGRLASGLYFSPDPERRERASRDALGCAESLGDPAALAYALSAEHYTLYRPGFLERRLENARRHLVAAHASGDEAHLALAHYHLAMDGMEAGDFSELDRQVAGYRELASRSGQPYHRWQVLWLEATRAVALGDLDEAEGFVADSLAAGRDAGSPNALLVYSGHLYGLRREQGRLGELLPMMAGLGRDVPDMPAFEAARAEAEWCADQESNVRAWLRDLVAQRLDGLPLDMNWPTVVSIAARLCVALEERDLATPLYRALAPLAGTCIVHPFATLWDGAVDAYLGMLSQLAGDPGRAEAHLARAESLHARLGARPWLERTRAARRGGASPAAGAEPAAGPEPARFTRIADGAWHVEFRGAQATLSPTRGALYLSALLARPGEDVHVLDLMALADPSGASPPMAGSDEVLDGRARAEVRERLAALREDLEEAQARSDLGAAERARAEIEALESSLASALGLGARARRLDDPVERARKSVYNRIRDAISRAEALHPELGRHLRRSVQTGRTCRYEPGRPVRWRVVC